MEKVFNKLVRDKIPDIIKNDGYNVVMRTLSDEEYRVELYNKLNEECQEVLNSKTSQETIEELADVLEVINCIANLENKDITDVMYIAKQKRLIRGSFKEKVFLEKTISSK